jgi:Profilin
LSGPEVTTICKGFDNNDAIFGSGIKIAGQKYFTIRADDKVIQGRKVNPWRLNVG